MVFLPRTGHHDVEKMVAIDALGNYFHPLRFQVRYRHVGKMAVGGRVSNQGCCGIAVLGSLLISDD